MRRDRIGSSHRSIPQTSSNSPTDKSYRRATRDARPTSPRRTTACSNGPGVHWYAYMAAATAVQRALLVAEVRKTQPDAGEKHLVYIDPRLTKVPAGLAPAGQPSRPER